jgi:hypothetical protein
MQFRRRQERILAGGTAAWACRRHIKVGERHCVVGLAGRRDDGCNRMFQFIATEGLGQSRAAKPGRLRQLCITASQQDRHHRPLRPDPHRSQADQWGCPVVERSGSPRATSPPLSRWCGLAWPHQYRCGCHSRTRTHGIPAEATPLDSGKNSRRRGRHQPITGREGCRRSPRCRHWSQDCETGAGFGYRRGRRRPSGAPELGRPL